MSFDPEPDPAVPSVAELVFDLVDGRLGADDAARAEALIQAQPEAAALADWFRSFRVSAERVSTPAVPRQVIQDLVRAFRAHHARPSGAQRLRQAARLVLDTLATPSLAGVRGLDTGTRQLVFEADGVDVAVTLVDRPDGSTSVIGSVLGATGGTVGVQLLGRPADQVSDPVRDPVRDPDAGPDAVPAGGRVDALVVMDDVDTDDLGEFEVAPLWPGRYRFVVSVGDRTIETDVIDIVDRTAR